MTRDEIIAKAESFTGGWYHIIELTPGYFTRSYREANVHQQWDMIRRVRNELGYADRTVLDIGTMDGMWAFEAEKLGAKTVDAIDIWQNNYTTAKDRFEFAWKALNSKVRFTEDSVEELRTVTSDFNRTFDIIQCPGVLYHLENPMRALRMMRNAGRVGTMLLLETAVWPGTGAPMARFNSDKGVYNDPTTFWAPNVFCLNAMLEMTGWQPFFSTRQTLKAGPTERHCLICKAV